MLDNRSGHQCNALRMKDECLRRNPPMPSPREELQDDLSRNTQRFLLVTGSGISRSTCAVAHCASWTGLLQNGVNHCRSQLADLPAEWVTVQQTYLKMSRPTDLVLVATAVTSELDHIHPAEY